MADKPNMSDDADAIERDVMETQDEMGDTIQKLEDKLNPRDMTEGLLGEDGMETAKEALDIARRNPMPVALIAIGAVWLFATSDAPMIREMRRRLVGGVTGRDRSPDRSALRARSAQPVPIGPPPSVGDEYDRAFATSGS